jgi:Sigma-70, region 4/SnoaL-like domain
VPAGEIGHLQPYPDRLLEQLTDADADPAAIAERRESIALAFITALQRLPAGQRAALILRDVLAWNAAEVAALLEISVPAVNSALQRARATLSGTRPADSGIARPRLDDHQRQVLDRFTDAWQRCDIDALAALLREDLILSMPPELARITGRTQVTRFFTTVPPAAASTRSAWSAPGRTATRRWPPTCRTSPRAATDTGSWSSPSPAKASPRSPASPALTCSRGSACPLSASDGSEDPQPGAFQPGVLTGSRGCRSRSGSRRPSRSAGCRGRGCRRRP